MGYVMISSKINLGFGKPSGTEYLKTCTLRTKADSYVDSFSFELAKVTFSLEMGYPQQQFQHLIRRIYQNRGA